MEIVGTILVRIIFLPFVGLVCSRAALEIAHAYNWYPERHLAELFMTAPSVFAIDAVWWGLLAFGATILWLVADYFFYRRKPKITPMPKRMIRLDDLAKRLKHEAPEVGIAHITILDNRDRRLADDLAAIFNMHGWELNYTKTLQTHAYVEGTIVAGIQ